jgi:hypothetical protein
MDQFSQQVEVGLCQPVRLINNVWRPPARCRFCFHSSPRPDIRKRGK